MPRRTRILLVEMPRMLSDILADVLSAEPDMEVVGVLSSRGKLRATVAETRADVVVLALGDSRLPKDCGRLLRAHPRLRVLGVTSAATGQRVTISTDDRKPLAVVAAMPAEVAVGQDFTLDGTEADPVPGHQTMSYCSRLRAVNASARAVAAARDDGITAPRREH